MVKNKSMKTKNKILSILIFLSLTPIGCTDHNNDRRSMEDPGDSTVFTAPILKSLSLIWADSESITLEQPTLSLPVYPLPSVYAYIGVNGSITATGPVITNSSEGPVDVTRNNYIFKNLSTGTTYRIMVVAENSEGFSVKETTHTIGTPLPVLIVADHTIVEDYSKIPPVYINKVKTMLLNIPGESHGRGYVYGLELLEALDSRFQVNATWTGEPEGPVSTHLRIVRSFRNSSNTGWVSEGGEEDFWTNSGAIEMLKQHLTYMRNTGNNPVSALGFGWCWDMTWHNTPGGTVDPVYKVRWAGSSVGGPDGDLQWGLDSGDNTLTLNSVNMQTYLDAVETYNSHDPLTITFYTTGPVDGYTDESGYQRYLKHEYIRSYVNQAGSTRVLFDYADILVHDSNGVKNYGPGWTDGDGVHHDYPVIVPAYDIEWDGGEGSAHISQEGCLKIGKALWWMLARISGWDGN